MTKNGNRRRDGVPAAAANARSRSGSEFREVPAETQAPQHVRHGPYGPTAVAVAKFLVPYVGCENIVGLFHEVDERWPNLSLRDLIGAMVLAEALAMKPEGNA
jgi:hypothetical protein